MRIRALLHVVGSNHSQILVQRADAELRSHRVLWKQGLQRFRCKGFQLKMKPNPSPGFKRQEYATRAGLVLSV